MNPHHCPMCGKFDTHDRRQRRDSRRGDLLAMMQGERRPSEPHQRGERTKAKKRSAGRWDHVRALLAAGVDCPKAARLLREHGNG